MESHFKFDIEKDSREFENFLQQNLDALVQHYHRSEQKNRSLYENSPDLLRTENLDGIIVECNKSYNESLGFSKDEILGRSALDHIAERSLNDLKEALTDWKNTGTVRSKEIWLKRKDGNKFPALFSASSLYDTDGNLIGRIASFKDMSGISQKSTDAEQHKIRHISEMGALSARIAHDIKNPLSVIKNTVELMKMRANNLDEKTKSDCLRIERATVRIAHQIEEVLDYVWPKPLELSEASVFRVLESCISKINLQQVSIDTPKNDIRITCDPTKLEIVFSNLILNAIQAMSGKGKISIKLMDEGESITVEVEDTGQGIPADVLPKIFEPLFTTRHIGTGLGLVSCKSIVEKHGGRIDVRTQIGNGTTFIIRLPKTHVTEQTL